MKFGKLIAHRGLHSKDAFIPENSIEAFKQAVNAGFDIELDVCLTKDKHVVVFHDENLERMTGVNKRVSDSTLEEIKKLKLLDTDSIIPTLAEALRTVKGRVGVLIELKNQDIIPGMLEAAVYNTIKNYKGYTAVQSFNPLRIRWFLKNAPHIDRGQLVMDFKYDNIINNNFIKNLATKPKVYNYLSRPNFVCIDLKCIDMAKIINAFDNNCDIITWTATTPTLLAEALKFSKSVIFDNFIPQK